MIVVNPQMLTLAKLLTKTSSGHVSPSAGHVCDIGRKALWCVRQRVGRGMGVGETDNENFEWSHACVVTEALWCAKRGMGVGMCAL